MKNNIYLPLKSILLPLFIWLLMVMSIPGMAQTITTDKADYLPGEQVQITGNGWQAGEMISLTIKHLVFTDHPDEFINTNADEAGNITNAVYTIDSWDLGETFLLTSTGQSSGLVATTTFTDAGGSYTLKWYAADPAINKGPYAPTYAKLNPASLPCTVSGGRASNPLANSVAYASPANASNLDAVTSLAPKNMALCQVVPFFLEILVNGTTTPENGIITFTTDWLAKTTSGDDFGFDPSYGLYCAFVDIADPGTYDPGNNAKVDSYTSTTLGTGTNNERIHGTVQVSGLNDGDKIIVELWVVLKCTIPAGSTGNVQTSLQDAHTGLSTTTGSTINTGNQTVPLLRVQEFFTSDADIQVEKNSSPVCFGDNINYTIVVKNNASETVANGVVATDVLGSNQIFVSASGAAYTQVGQTVTFQVGALSPLESKTLTIVATPTISGTVTNSVTVTAITNDPVTANNAASTSTTVSQTSVTVNDQAVCYGEDVTFTANVSGTGYSFVWSVNGTAQSPTTSNTLTLNDVTANATISVTVTPTSGNTTCTALDDANLNVNPAISVSVDDEAVCYGEDVTFTAYANGGTGSYTFEWKVDDAIQQGITGNELTLSDVMADALISVTVSDDFTPTQGATACTASDDANLNVNPAISVSVDDEAVCYGEDVTFTAYANGGTGSYTFEWKVDDAIQQGITGNELTLSDVMADALISVTVSDDFTPTQGATACTASDDANLDVNPAISVSVDDEAVCYGEDVTFTAYAEGGTGNFTYEWKVGDAIQASTTSTMSLDNVTAGAAITVTVTDDFEPTDGAAACTATDDASLTVNPAITVTVDDEAVCYGEDVTFTANASGGTGNFTYEWSVDGVSMPATQENTLTLSDVAADANISVTVNDDFFTNNILLKSAILSCNATDNAFLDVNPAISVTVDDQAVCFGEDVTFTANASGGTGNFTYEWSVDGVSMPATQENTLTLSDVATDANISVTINDDFVPTFGATACTATDDASLTVNPAISVSVDDEAICFGEDVTFTANASGGTGNFTYVWSVDGESQPATSSNTLDLENVTADAAISVTVNDDFVPTFGATACTATDDAALDVNEQITVSISADPNCELGKAGLPNGIITVTGSGYETLELWSAGADDAIGGGDDELIESATTSSSPYEFDEIYSGSYYVIALSPHPSGTGTCDETSNVAFVDECYWFNIAKVTQGKVDPTKDWRFNIYVGPDGFGKTSEGSASTLNDADGILTFGNVNLDPSKTYTICEEQMAAGWSAIWVTDINGTQTVLMTYNPNGDETPPQDLGNRCFDIGAGTQYPLYPNDIFTIHVDNTYPGGTARTPGYWKNWASCTGGGQEANAARNGGWQAGYWILDDVLNSPGVTLGAYKVTTCQIGVKILDQRDIITGKKSASDPIYTLAMHLMAFKCNQAAGAYGCPYAIDAAAKADLLLISVGYNAQGTYTKKLTKANSSYALSLAKILDEYNNNRLSATDCAKTVKSAELAEIGVPATPFESTFRAYPNPFTEKLNIEFSAATDTQVRLEIYSITGARLEVLFNGPVNGGELYTVEYLPKLVSSQIVFYHLTINGTIQVGKLIYNERR